MFLQLFLHPILCRNFVLRHPLRDLVGLQDLSTFLSTRHFLDCVPDHIIHNEYNVIFMLTLTHQFVFLTRFTI